MSPRYLLPCSCGLSTPVETAQAGETIQCACGAKLDVPTLRGLRNLSPAPLEPGTQGPVWHPGKGIMFLGVLAILAGLGIGAYLRWSVPTVDVSSIHEEILTLSPAEAWQKWRQYLQALPGPPSARTHAFDHSRPLRRRLELSSWAAVIIGAGVVYCGYFMLKRARKKVDA